MSEKKRIACFFTGGYTELNAMKSFMKKINDRHEYIQLCPTGQRKSKAMIQHRRTDTISSTQNGLTGESLINYISEFVQKKRFQEEAYDAILIEDDKDQRFLSFQDDGTVSFDMDKWNRFKQGARKKLKGVSSDVPILFFLATPEVEAWFIADWEHSFKLVYKDQLTIEQNDYFSFQFRKHVKEQILTQKYVDSIEEYGYFDGTYRKLSEEIQNALSEIDFLSGFGGEIEHPSIRYSKRMQGERMLESIEPQTVAEKCSKLFRSALYELRDL